MRAERLGRAATGLLLAGCVSSTPVPPPTTPQQTWTIPESVRAEVSEVLTRDGRAGAADRMPRPAGQGVGPDALVLDPARAYDLGELIDFAQRNNPATRTAWEEARQAALATGVAHSTLLPRLAASVVGGYQRISTPITLPFGVTRDLTTDVQAITPILTVEWLLFDFGERAAAVEASRHLTIAANVRFNQAHQLLVFEVSRAFHALAAGARKETDAGRALAAARQILSAAETRERQGVGTRIEIAQARAQVAQAELSRVQAQGETAAARVDLNGALGAPHGTPVRIRDTGGSLPAGTLDTLDQVIERALAQRPDIIASVEGLLAAEAQERVATAGFAPKVGLIAGLSTEENQFRINNSSILGLPLQQTGVLLGVTIPLYDGGSRRSALQSAHSRVMAAQAAVATARSAAAQEIAAAYEALRSSLAAYHAADALVVATRVTADAGRQGFELGLQTLTEAVAAEKALLDAENALTDSRRAAFDAAASLAFVTAAVPMEPNPSNRD